MTLSEYQRELLKADAAQCNKKLRNIMGIGTTWKSPVVARRQEEVRKLRDLGLPRREIAYRLRVSVPTVARDIYAISKEDSHDGSE